jgi:hypothetical protein
LSKTGDRPRFSLDQTPTLASEDLRAAAQALLAEVQPDAVSEEGEFVMFVMDMPPDVPPQYAPVVIAQASQTGSTKVNGERTIGVCHLIENRVESRLSAKNSLSPVVAAWGYLTYTEHRLIDQDARRAATVKLLQPPEHGELEIDSRGRAGYFPNTPDYFGTDRATVLVEMGEYKIKLLYFFKLMRSVPSANEGYDPYEDPKYCPQGMRVQRISLDSSDPNTQLLAAVGSPDLTSFLGDIPNANLAIADLPGTAVGQTTANTITLDLDAASHGWFIDSTPYDNSEFLPTSDPNVWVAKPGSAAEGKMDMLTVLLHEYGHVLGLDHSADANDLMGANLQPGVRHTIGTEIYEQIWSLVGDSGPFDPRAPLPPSLPLGLPLLFGLGRMRLQGASEPIYCMR